MSYQLESSKSPLAELYCKSNPIDFLLDTAIRKAPLDILLNPENDPGKNAQLGQWIRDLQHPPDELDLFLADFFNNRARRDSDPKIDWRPGNPPLGRRT